MKKSKSSSSSKGKRKRSPVEDKGKHAKSLPITIDKQNKKDNEDKLRRKTRWETSNSNLKNDTDKQASSRTDETSNPEPPRRIKDMLGDKMKIIEYLFQTVTVTALQDIIPDYLKNRSIEELKRLCSDEIKLLDNEIILNIASGKYSSHSNETKTSSSKLNDKPINSKNLETKEDNVNCPVALDSPAVSEACTNDLLELCATSDEMKDLADKEYEVVVEEEVAEDLGVIDTDASLIELEMRARAIRSLLKAKGQSLSDSE